MSHLDENQHPIVKPINELLKKEVDRYEFLKIVGFGVITLIGMSSIIHFLTGKNSKAVVEHLSNYTTTNYGNSRYGV